MRKCPFSGCNNYIRPTFFACAHHWQTLNHGEQERIYAAYRAYYASSLTLDGLRAIQQEVLGFRGRAWSREELAQDVKRITDG